MSSGFVSQNELEDERKARQEEWERVRKPDDPMTAPEPEVCYKSLYDQLKENKDKKQMEIDEAKAFKNMIRGVDEDEVEFLAMVDKKKLEADRQRRQEEKEMLAALSNTVIPAVEPVLLRPQVTAKVVPNKQAQLLMGAVKRRTSGTDEASSSKHVKQDATPSTSTKTTGQDDVSLQTSDAATSSKQTSKQEATTNLPAAAKRDANTVDEATTKSTPITTQKEATTTIPALLAYAEYSDSDDDEENN